MRFRTAFAIISALATTAIASAQGAAAAAAPTPLTIGDSTPAFNIAGTIKGDKIDSLKKGKTYVIEFWATWCGPCIASMPHLSDMADKYKGKVDFVSVNTWDFRTSDPKVKEEPAAHEKRVADWVAKNTDKMRYNIVLDDQADTIATTWMRAAGRNGIPCAFIVNGDGKIAWIGHPMQMEKPLEEISNGSWDMAAFKTKFDEEAKAAREAAAAQAKLAGLIKTGDQAAVEAYIDSAKEPKIAAFYQVLNAGLNTNPDLVANLVKKYEGKLSGGTPALWCQLSSLLTSKVKDASVKTDLVKISEKNANAADAKVAAGIYLSHAQALIGAGDKDGAAQWLEKAKGALDQYEPATRREALGKQIEAMAKSLKG